MSEQGWIFAVGIFVAIISYLLKNFVLDRVIHYKSTVGQVRNRLKYYANVFGNDVQLDLQREASKEVRQLSCDLEEVYYAIGFRKLLALVRIIPSDVSIDSAAQGLIGLSNSTGDKGNPDRLYGEQREIKQLLGIDKKSDSK